MSIIRSKVFILAATLLGLQCFVSSDSAAAAKRGTASTSAVATSVGLTPVDAAAATLVRVREMIKKDQLESALKKLRGEWGQQLTQAQAEPILRFTMARILEDLKRDGEAATEYTKALEKKSTLDSQIRFAAGRVYARTGQTAQAREAFAGILQADSKDVPVAIRSRAVLELAKLMAGAAEKDPKQWKDVIKTLQPAMKAARGQDVYPSYLYLLMRAKRKTGTTDCKIARDLFAKYPAAPEVMAWGPLLPHNKIDDLKITCSATAKDIQTRLKRLQLQGQVDRSIQEIHDLKTAGVFDAWTLDSFEMAAMLANGQNQDAMKMLMKHSEAQKGRPQFWNLLGRVTSRLGDFAASAGPIKKRTTWRPRERPRVTRFSVQLSPVTKCKITMGPKKASRFFRHAMGNRKSRAMLVGTWRG